jgi:glycosyltransferase involved in cell wall biosynthesis
MISVLILTRNEQQDLPGCLASVAWSDDVHVFDSFSIDATVEIARAAGAHVYQRTFDDYAQQRNAALRDIPFKYPWLFILDADERASQELASQMLEAVPFTPADISGFRLRRRDYFFCTWLKHAQITPFYIRLVRHERAHYTRAINEVLEVEGGIGNIPSPFDHFPFSKGIAQWLEKHNGYSTREAQLIYHKQGLRNPSLRTALSDRSSQRRRLHQKAIFYLLPFRPVLKFLYMTLLRGAILDGRAGLSYAALQSIYEYLIVLKTEELHRFGPPPK